MDELDFLWQKGVQQFIHENRDVDVSKLLLNPPKEFEDHIKLIADQILARQKAKGKLESWVSNPELIFPPPLSVEQASSQETATYKKSIFSGNQLIDLTGGMGVDTLALSEGFNSTTYVEKDLRLCEVFSHNSAALGKVISVINLEAEQMVSELEGDDNYVFIDPARRDLSKNKVFKLEDCTPNILTLLPGLEDKAKQVLIKLSPLLDIKSLIAQLKGVKEIHVVAVKNEVKELLVLIDFEFSEEPLVKTINLHSLNQPFNFHYSEEEKTESTIGSLQAYLLEPNAAILKAGAFKKVGKDFEVAKLHPNTHLYTSDLLPENWPGRVFKIIETDAKKNLNNYLDRGKINVITRNYPLDVVSLKKKFKVKDGGDYFLIGFRDHESVPRLIVAKLAD